MTDEDKSNLRDLHAGFALIGLLMADNTSEFDLANRAYKLADEMQEAREPHGEGIVSVKRRTKKEKADE
jgi:hypothetical protein